MEKLYPTQITLNLAFAKISGEIIRLKPPQIFIG